MEPSANLLVAAVHRHVAIVVLAVLLAVYLVFYAVVSVGEPAEASPAVPRRRQWWCGLWRGHDRDRSGVDRAAHRARTRTRICVRKVA